MQTKVSEFIQAYGLEAGETARFMDLVSEVGELGKELLKGTDYGAVPLEKTEGLEEEMGDCLFSLLALCHTLKIDSAQALGKVLEKYAARFSEKGDVGSGR